MSATAAEPKPTIELPASHFSRREEREGTAVVPLPVNATPMQMLAVAMNRGMDASTLKDLMDLNDRWQKGEAEKAYNEAFAAFKAEAVTIIKGRKVDQGPLSGKSYAELIDWVQGVTPALSKHGLAASWRVTKDEPQWIEVTCTLAHVKGHSRAVSMGGPPDAGGAKSAIQARASTVTYLERYTLKAITGLAEGGEDNDGAGATSMSVEEINKWVKAIEATTTKAKAKEVCVEAIAAAEALNDLGAYQTFKDTLKKHGEFIDTAGK